MAEKWQPPIVLKCLEEYYRHPCLWDVSSTEYKNKDKRQAALDEMASILKVTPEILKTKIHSIRNSYINEKNKIQRSMKSGARASEVHVPKLTWYTFADSFLGRVIQKRHSKSNVVSIFNF